MSMAWRPAVGSSKPLSLLLVGLGFGALCGLGCDRARQRSFWCYWRGGETHGRQAAGSEGGPSEKGLRPVGAVGFQRMGPMDDEFVDQHYRFNGLTLLAYLNYTPRTPSQNWTPDLL